MSESGQHRMAGVLRALAVPVLLFWIVAAAAVNIFVPSLEENTAANARAMVPRDAPSTQAAVRQGHDFDESDYASIAVVLLETRGRALGEQDHKFYDEMVRRLRDDKQHVQSLMDLWGDPVTMSGQQSADAQAATLIVRPVGDLGAAESNQATTAMRDIVAGIDKPDGLEVYVSGPAPLASDTLEAADESMFTLTIVTIVVIIVMMLLAYHSPTRVLIPLAGVLITLATARGVVSFLVGHQIIGISSFAMNMAVALVLGVSTDYGIFYLGRYHEAGRAGLDKESAYYASVSNTSHVVLGSGLAISGATLCLSLTKLDYGENEPAVAQAGHRDHPLAGGHDRDRRAGAAAVPGQPGQLHGQLQRPRFRAGHRRAGARLRRRRPAFPEKPW
jgi:RND superfamily putative drug exporter